MAGGSGAAETSSDVHQFYGVGAVSSTPAVQFLNVDIHTYCDEYKQKFGEGTYNDWERRKDVDTKYFGLKNIVK